MNANPAFPVDVESPDNRTAFSTWLKKRRWFIIFVVGPTLLAAIYYGMIASDIYISESRFVIKSPDQKRSQMSTLANLVQTTGMSGGQEQTKEVLTFVRSRDALKNLEKDAAIREKYSRSGTDFISRFPGFLSDDSFESLFKYYGAMTSARFDTESGTAIIKTNAFTPEDAYSINRHLLDLSEGLVNRLNSRAQTKGIAEAQRQVQIATERAREARLNLAKYRNAQALIDPSKQAVGVIEIANDIIAQRSALQAQLDLMQQVAPRNPSIPALRSRINAMTVQINAQDSRVVGAGDGIASKMGGYENLLVEQEFSTESMNTANAALVQAQAEAQRQQFYLERVVDPNRPDRPLLPKRMLNIIVVFAVATSLYFIVWMFMVGILEHAPED